MVKFFDVHTHKSTLEKSSISIQNVIPGQPVPESFFSAGIHPWYAADTSIGSLLPLVEHPLCVAIGECGFDGIKSSLTMQEQETLFRHQLAVARRFKKPVILHAVRCEQSLDRVLHDFSDLTYIWHGFAGNAEVVKRFSKFNLFFSFGTRGANKPDVWRHIEQKRLLCETDDSEMNIAEIYGSLSLILQTDIGELCELIRGNVEKIFEHGLEG